jgi:hypothetical protein
MAIQIWDGIESSLSKSYSKGEESSPAKMGKCGGKGKIPAESRCGDQVPTSLNTLSC